MSAGAVLVIWGAKGWCLLKWSSASQDCTLALSLRAARRASSSLYSRVCTDSSGASSIQAWAWFLRIDRVSSTARRELSEICGAKVHSASVDSASSSCMREIWSSRFADHFAKRSRKARFVSPVEKRPGGRESYSGPVDRWRCVAEDGRGGRPCCGVRTGVRVGPEARPCMPDCRGAAASSKDASSSSSLSPSSSSSSTTSSTCSTGREYHPNGCCSDEARESSPRTDSRA
mmetsp:Transcript_26776/g.90135  ORF Transcript_26776/g.90135 Transcript_26776/m.90135 type:complete len:231 (-) Transcript_26776:237-929(-)